MLLTAAVLVATLVVYPHLPGSVPTHWNMRGEPDAYSPKWTLFLIGPGLMAGMMSLMHFLPWFSPKRFEVDNFRSTYLQIMLIVVAMIGYFSAVILWSSVGHRFDVGRAIIGGTFLLFGSLGNLMGKVRRNFYIGVRTPWTLANERVWNTTHRWFLSCIRSCFINSCNGAGSCEGGAIIPLTIPHFPTCLYSFPREAAKSPLSRSRTCSVSWKSWWRYQKSIKPSSPPTNLLRTAIPSPSFAMTFANREPVSRSNATAIATPTASGKRHSRRPHARSLPSTHLWTDQ